MAAIVTALVAILAALTYAIQQGARKRRVDSERPPPWRESDIRAIVRDEIRPLRRRLGMPSVVDKD